MNTTETFVSTSTSDIATKFPLSQPTLREYVQQSMQRYLTQLEGFPPSNIYDMVIAEVEAPLLETIMHYTHDNQSKAAIILGISRGTLRKKLKQYELLEE